MEYFQLVLEFLPLFVFAEIWYASYYIFQLYSSFWLKQSSPPGLLYAFRCSGYTLSWKSNHLVNQRPNDCAGFLSTNHLVITTSLFISSPDIYSSNFNVLTRWCPLFNNLPETSWIYAQKNHFHIEQWFLRGFSYLAAFLSEICSYFKSLVIISLQILYYIICLTYKGFMHSRINLINSDFVFISHRISLGYLPILWILQLHSSSLYKR